MGMIEGESNSILARMDAQRLLDLFLVLGSIFIWLPILMFTAIAVKLTSKGPIIYRQTRVGKDGKLFTLYKFRTMIIDADKMGSSVTTSRDSRITWIGRLMRKTKLDELPQLWNVLQGEMALVGPRPDVPEIVAEYTSEMHRVLNVRPGITSVASLSLRNEEQILALFDNADQAYLDFVVPAKVELAMAHINQCSLWFDFKILLQTIWAVTFGRFLPQVEHPIVSQLRQYAEHQLTEHE
jgi:lipopolysaccharide/colanic/teichoic acid biosynthesis glycosyltransferase